MPNWDRKVAGFFKPGDSSCFPRTRIVAHVRRGRSARQMLILTSPNFEIGYPILSAF